MMSIQTVLWDAMRGYDDVPISRRIRDSVNQKHITIIPLKHL